MLQYLYIHVCMSIYMYAHMYASSSSSSNFPLLEQEKYPLCHKHKGIDESNAKQFMLVCMTRVMNECIYVCMLTCM